jgi:CBS domain-containing protein
MLMRARRGAVVVLEGTKPAGIFTERDVVYRLPAALYPSREDRRRTPLARVMTASPVTVERRAGLGEALRRMVTGGHRHLVVVDEKGDLAGLLTANDIVQFLTDQFPEETMNVPPRLHQRYHRRGGA